MHRFRSFRAPALVLTVLALVAALGGTAAAAKLLTGKDIRNSSLTGADIKNKSLTKADFKGSVTGAKGAAGPAGAQGPKGDAGAKGDPGAQGPQGPAGTPDGFTKTEANAAFLAKGAKAADADKLDGVDGDDLVAGDARIAFNALNRTFGSETVDLIDVGDVGTVRATCGAAGAKTLAFQGAGAGEVAVAVTRVTDGAPTDVAGPFLVANGETVGFGTNSGNYKTTIQVSRTPVNPSGSSDFSTVEISALDSATCRFLAHTIDSEKDGTLDLAP